jgi:hypothetical protein
MIDAFDQWTEWRHKSADHRRSIPADLYSTVMSLPDPDRADRQKVNEAVRRHDEARRAGRTVWLYLNDYQGGTSRRIGDPEWVKVFGSAQGSEKWLEQNDAEGVVWEYEVEGGQAQRSIWLYAPNPQSRAIGDPDWVKLFASKERAEISVENNDPKRDVWEYPIQE